MKPGLTDQEEVQVERVALVVLEELEVQVGPEAQEVQAELEAQEGRVVARAVHLTAPPLALSNAKAHVKSTRKRIVVHAQVHASLHASISVIKAVWQLAAIAVQTCASLAIISAQRHVPE